LIRNFKAKIGIFMNFSRLSASLVSFSVIVIPLSAVGAQSVSSQAEPGLGGSAIAGVCLLSREAVFANAAVGKAASARLKQIAEAAQTEIQMDAKSFQADVAKLTPEQRKSREQELATRIQAGQAKAQQRSREIDATRAKALDRIASEIQPLVARIYKERNCGLLVDRNSVLGGNMANDLTAAVVKALDAKVTTISFNRENLALQSQPGKQSN
jgi:Skp family chaperone for outer membrane proteins